MLASYLRLISQPRHVHPLSHLEMFKVQGSRRSVGLKPADYDHQISLVDHDGSQPQRLTSTASHNTELTRSSTTSRLIQPHQQRRRSGEINGQQSNGSAASSLSPRRQRASEDSNVKHNTLPHSQDTAVESQSQSDLPHPALEPSIEIHGKHHSSIQVISKENSMLTIMFS